VALRLSAPQQMSGFLNSTPQVSTVYLAVDEPERFIKELRQWLERHDQQQ
jgi:hypothetical protein